MNQNGIMLPPLPTGKDQSGKNKGKCGQSTAANRPEGSLRNPRTHGQGGSYTGNPGQAVTAPPTRNMTTPSPSAILGNPSFGMNTSRQQVPSMSIFGRTDFVGSQPTLEALDVSSRKILNDISHDGATKERTSSDH
jgi:hypothetical protein